MWFARFKAVMGMNSLLWCEISLSRAARHNPLHMLKIIGAGFGRTGTSSLKLALEQLGFGRCYHFRNMLADWHVPRWRRILAGGDADWDRIFHGYASTADFPAAAFYRELAAHYPAAKVILSTRDPEAWYRSTRETLLPLRRALPTWLPPFGHIAEVTDKLLWQGAFEGRFDDREYMLQRYARHLAQVRAAIAPERLLVFDVRQGWEPLCAFLGVPVPATPFPRVNDTRHMRNIVWLIRAAHVLLLSAMFGGAAWLVATLI
jgi:hypothetical protein